MMNDGTPKTRICYVIPSLQPGGTERQLLYLVEQLRETHSCTILCTRGGGAWAERARAAGAEVRELNTWGGWDFRIGGRVREALAEIRPNIVHTFLFGFDYAVNRAARDCGVPVVISSRRELAAWMKPRHVRTQRRANAVVDCIVANSHAAAAFAEKLESPADGLLRVIHNGIDADAFALTATDARVRERLGIPEGRAVVGMVANFSAVKDHALFLAAADLLMRARRDAHFLLVGSGPLQEQIVQAIHGNGWRERFTVTATSEDTAGLMRLMDVMVLTSKREGFPNVLLEAMAVQRPVVAAAVGGVPEIIEHEHSGLLVGSREPEGFAEAIGRVLDDSDFAGRLARNAAERVRAEFSVERMAASYRALYAELIAGAGARA